MNYKLLQNNPTMSVFSHIFKDNHSCKFAHLHMATRLCSCNVADYIKQLDRHSYVNLDTDWVDSIL